MPQTQGFYSSPQRRWAGVGPYYAMFPTRFADGVVRRYAPPRSAVLDPFAGRGTSVFSAATNGRSGVGVELSPVGWTFSQAKLRPAPLGCVLTRLYELRRAAGRLGQVPDLPEFFSWCFAGEVLRFLLVARTLLDWRRSVVDRTLMALILVNLHGKRSSSLSNQMRQSKSMSPNYSVNWWRERGLRPPELDPVRFMEARIEWRYAAGTPAADPSLVYLGDAAQRLGSVALRERVRRLGRVKLLLTSPPYCGVTNYRYDQWLRLWLLGGPPNAHAMPGTCPGRFASRSAYRTLLERVFARASALMDDDAVAYVRTDHRAASLDVTTEVLRAVFPQKRLFRRRRPVRKPTQTHLFANSVGRSAEVDIVLVPHSR